MEGGDLIATTILQVLILLLNLDTLIGLIIYSLVFKGRKEVIK